MKLSLSLLLCIILSNAMAQDAENTEIESIIESSVLNSDDEIDYSDLATNQIQTNSRKRNLNKISTLELQSLNIISLYQIDALVNHIKDYGPLKSKYELQTIEALDSSTIYLMLKFFDINEFSIELLLKQKHQQMLRLKYSYRFEKSLGFILSDSNKFSGNRSKIGGLYNSESGNLDYGFHFEKDAGESSKILFHSAYILLKPKTKVKNILIGDQQIACAQGLNIGTGMSSGMSSLVMQVLKNNVGCKAYKSFNESGFLRGISIKVQAIKKIELSIFSGIRLLDTKLKNDSNSLSFGSILSSGYYRNHNEINSRHQLIQYVTGYHANYKFKNFEIGNSLVYNKININPLLKRENNQTDFQTEKYFRMGLDWKWQIKNKLLFGEMVFDKKLKPTYLFGLLSSIGKKTDLSILARHYADDFDSKLSNGFGASSKNQNEYGLYIGLCAPLPAKMSLSIYYDMSRFDQPKFRVDAPSYQIEQMVEISYKAKNPFSFYLRYKHNQFAQNKQSEESIHSLEKHDKKVYRLHGEFKLGKIKIRNRVELVQYQIENQKPSLGSLIYHDVQIPCTNRLNICLRYCMFGSDDYNSRTFAYENDVPGTFNIPSYNGKGTRTYALIKYQIQKDLQIWFRFARSKYEGVQSNGSGLNLIELPHTSDMNIQLQWKF